MTASARIIDIRGLKPYSISNKSPLWWGQLLMCFIEASMFFLLIAMYFYLRLSVDVWPPPGTQLPHTMWPTIGLVPLLLSIVGSYIASEGAKSNSRSKMLIGLGLNLLLAFAFIVCRGIEISTLNFTWSTDVHGSIFWTMLFLHSLDAVADMLYTLVLFVIVAFGLVGQKQRLGVHVDAVVWYFIVAIWIPMYAVMYWGPHFVGAPK